MASKTAAVVLALAVFTAIGVILLGPVSGVVNANTGTQTVTNESVSATFSDPVDLTGYDISSDSVTVYGYNDSSGSYEAAPASDYSVNKGPGTISFSNSSSLIDDGETTKVSYDYQATGAISSLVIGFTPLALGLFIFAAIANRVQGMM